VAVKIKSGRRPRHQAAELLPSSESERQWRCRPATERAPAACQPLWNVVSLAQRAGCVKSQAVVSARCDQGGSR
jgi:hypothetical protein